MIEEDIVNLTNGLGIDNLDEQWFSPAKVRLDSQSFRNRAIPTDDFLISQREVDFSTKSVDEIGILLSEDSSLIHQFSYWLEINGPKLALEIIQSENSVAIAIIGSINGLSRWIQKNDSLKDDNERVPLAAIILGAIENLEDDVVFKNKEIITASLRTVSFLRIDENKDRLIAQIDRLLPQFVNEENEERTNQEPVTETINSDTYEMVQAIIGLLPSIADGSLNGIPDDVNRKLEIFLNGATSIKSKAILTITRNLAFFYRLDQKWTDTNILPLFSDKEEKVCEYAWCGFLWNPRITKTIVENLSGLLHIGLKAVSGFERTSNYFGALPLVFHFYFPEIFPASDLRQMYKLLNKDQVAESLNRIVQLSPDKAEDSETWNGWLLHVLSELPVETSKYGELSNIYIISLVIKSGAIVDDVFDLVRHLIVPSKRFESSLHDMLGNEAIFICNFPDLALEIAVRSSCDYPERWQIKMLAEVLEVISITKPALNHDPRYMSLKEKCS